MASNEVVILRVDASSGDGECLCTGENRAAKEQRKTKASERERRGLSSLEDVAIVCVEAGNPRKKKSGVGSSEASNGFPAVFVINSDDEEDEPMEVGSGGPSSSGGGSSGGTEEPSGAGNSGIYKKYKQNLSRALAISLQEDLSIVMESRVNKPGTSSSSSSSAHSSIFPSPSRATVADKVHEDSSLSTSAAAATLSQKASPLHRKQPTCWTECPNCPPDASRKYHLITVSTDGGEWNVVAHPLVQAGFNVSRVQRIQNEMIWQRLCFEKQLMLRERADVNERFLYHCSRSATSVICEEGLDQRLSRSNGCFGSGIYFSDDPVKCNTYSFSTQGRHGCKTMFCCRVLLGHTKIYPDGVCDRALVREPPKENPLPGESKIYDSVQGNITGQNEFVVYNNYRVMPEYVIEYFTKSNHHTSDPFSKLLRLSVQSYRYNHARMKYKRRKGRHKSH